MTCATSRGHGRLDGLVAASGGEHTASRQCARKRIRGGGRAGQNDQNPAWECRNTIGWEAGGRLLGRAWRPQRLTSGLDDGWTSEPVNQHVEKEGRSSRVALLEWVWSNNLQCRIGWSAQLHENAIPGSKGPPSTCIASGHAPTRVVCPWS